ncbi:MAG: cyclic nucleotide-binding domain-containing protein [Mariprofundaceae bacterium]
MSIDILWMEENILLQKLMHDDRQVICDLFKIRHYRAGDVIISQGSSGGGLHILRSGNAVITCNENNRFTFLADATEAALFGVMSFLTNEDSSATVTAHGHCTVYELSRQGYCTLMVKNHELLLSLLTHMVTYTSDVIKKMNRARAGEP